MNKKDQPSVIVTRKVPILVENKLKKHFRVKLNESDKKFSPSDLKEALRKADGLLCTVSDQLSSDIISTASKKTKIISNIGVGVSNISLNAAQKEQITVTNTPDVLTDATADVALFLILAVSRRTSYLEAKLRRNEWSGFSIVEDLGVSLKGKTLGIIGMGRIGKATAIRAQKALGMEIMFYNRSKISGLDFVAYQAATLDELLKESDVVSINAPGGAPQPIIKEADLLKMKPSAYLVNTARGDVIDQNALIKALTNKTIAGAGLDVFDNEPNVPRELIALENVTLLPHIGSATIETREAMGMLAVENLIAFFSNKLIPNRVI
ncbi:MAG: D-glycerate dehydrogenase [Pseudomonadota bacterium]|nr:D-glycerate dehydrogenase [Pseudomonadota bacterium]